MKIPSPSPDRTRVFHRIDSRRANPRRFIPDTNLGRGITFKLIIPVASRDCRHSETASVTRVLLRPACNFNNNYDHARCWRGEGRIRGVPYENEGRGETEDSLYIYIYTPHRYHFNHRPSKSKIPMKILISFKMLSIIFETTYHYRVYTYPRCGREERRTEKGDQLEIIELLRLGYLSREMGRVNEAEVTRV